MLSSLIFLHLHRVAYMHTAVADVVELAHMQGFAAIVKHSIWHWLSFVIQVSRPAFANDRVIDDSICNAVGGYMRPSLSLPQTVCCRWHR